MQLPRGTFREIKKNQNTGDILESLEREQFTGICGLSFRDHISTLVLKAGKCILAEYETYKGDSALKQLLSALADKQIDIALSTLTETQVKLSLEFNREERIVHSQYSLSVSRDLLDQPMITAPDTTRKKTGPAKKIADTSPPGLKIPVKKPTATGQTVTIPVQKEGEPGPGDSAQLESESELDALDGINLDQMTDKIRDECKTMVKNLQMDHLIEKD